MTNLQKNRKIICTIVIAMISIVIINGIVIYYANLRTKNSVTFIAIKDPIVEEVAANSVILQPGIEDDQKHDSINEYLKIYEKLVREIESRWTRDELFYDVIFSNDDQQFCKLVKFMNSKWIAWCWPWNKLSSYSKSVPNLSIACIIKKIQQLPVDISNLLVDKEILCKALHLTGENEHMVLNVIACFFKLKRKGFSVQHNDMGLFEWMSSSTLNEVFDTLSQLLLEVRNMNFDAAKIKTVKDALRMSEDEGDKRLAVLITALKTIATADDWLVIDNVCANLMLIIEHQWKSNSEATELVEVLHNCTKTIQPCVNLDTVLIQPLLMYLKSTAGVPKEHVDCVAVIVLSIVNLVSNRNTSNLQFLMSYYIEFDNYYLEYKKIDPKPKYYGKNHLLELYSDIRAARKLWNVIEKQVSL